MVMSSRYSESSTSPDAASAYRAGKIHGFPLPPVLTVLYRLTDAWRCASAHLENALSSISTRRPILTMHLANPLSWALKISQRSPDCDGQGCRSQNWRTVIKLEIGLSMIVTFRQILKAYVAEWG